MRKIIKLDESYVEELAQVGFESGHCQVVLDNQWCEKTNKEYFITYKWLKQ